MGNGNGIGIKLFNGRLFKTRSHNQTRYVEDILSNFITFGLGAAGSGKTYAACATALHLLSQKHTKKIIITRPAVEAGEELGFLPGTLEEKIAPYLFPLFDAIDDLCGKQKRESMISGGQLEILPLAYMRGRTLDDAFIILDEGQNATKQQMQMFLTRLGKNGKIVVNGDQSQNDLPHYATSGLMDAVNRLEGKQGIAVARFSTQDVVRHPVVKTVIEAYADE
jgi:phosphate starvation-inducible PhoH-like protein